MGDAEMLGQFDKVAAYRRVRECRGAKTDTPEQKGDD